MPFEQSLLGSVSVHRAHRVLKVKPMKLRPEPSIKPMNNNNNYLKKEIKGKKKKKKNEIESNSITKIKHHWFVYQTSHSLILFSLLLIIDWLFLDHKVFLNMEPTMHEMRLFKALFLFFF